ncbi:hypothetical protein TWF569_005479 [Orbilia oligospora]|uniref:Uncharacterized protein n=1 Tax=Orbilia oligospora TaxID=2813651 RepID=A0A7C8N055_ORBOL|nr:hypothetical protein TWF102_003869 [Orbilia oligospora]KAF3083582.1 hypothetical protein TWF103_002901 [Orbilia oligospora]KAF3141400.1 hypothetical protein TWF594_005958 [Orbilia oligospora]KAF3156491.1 hypothetical protein TWF569_005479 [Orbilia oligospora]
MPDGGPSRLHSGSVSKGRRRRSSSIIYVEPPETIEQLSDQVALPNLNANWVNNKGQFLRFEYRGQREYWKEKDLKARIIRFSRRRTGGNSRHPGMTHLIGIRNIKKPKLGKLLTATENRCLANSSSVHCWSENIL